MMPEKGAVETFDRAVRKINKINPDFVISGGAVCGNWWTGELHGIEEGFLTIEIDGDRFNWEYIDYDK